MQNKSFHNGIDENGAIDCDVCGNPQVVAGCNMCEACLDAAKGIESLRAELGQQAEYVTSASSIDALCDALNACERLVQQARKLGDRDIAVSDFVDFCDLPQFAHADGYVPTNVWSIAPESVLRGDGPSGQPWTVFPGDSRRPLGWEPADD